MKKRSLLLIGLFISSLLISAQTAPGNKTLTTKIEYEVKIRHDYNSFQSAEDLGSEIEFAWMRENIEPSYRLPFLEKLVAGALKGDIQVYIDPECTQIMSPIDVEFLLHPRDTVNMPDVNDPSVLEPIVVVAEFDPKNIESIFFTEQWTYNESTMKIDKKIMSYAPIVKVYMDNFSGDREYNGKRKLFYINVGYPTTKK